jgi:hypothetical protein
MQVVDARSPVDGAPTFPIEVYITVCHSWMVV